MPYTTTVTEIQRNFKKVDQKAKKTMEPLVVLSNNQPTGVYIDYAIFEKILPKKAIRKSGKNDFSEFRGLWTKKEAEDFNKTLDEMFEKIDPEMWK